MAALNKNILAVSWAMPPLLFPRALQISRLLKQWASEGWRTTVLTADPRSLGSSVLMDEPLAAYYNPSYTTVPIKSPEESLALRGLFRLAPFLKHMPDEKRLWANRAYAAASESSALNQASVILSFAQPWSSHLVGLRLQDKTGLPWIAHFSDPWTIGSHAKMTLWQARQARKWEALVVDRAAKLVFVTQEAADATLLNYPAAAKKKVRVVPHGFDRDILKALKPSAPKSGLLTLVHTGHFYGGRTPWALLKALAELNRRSSLAGILEVQFIGYMPSDFLAKANKLGLAPVIKALGPKSYLGSLQALQDADVLLLIEAESPNNLYFPSKLVDYFLFQKPIFGLTPNRGPSAALLSQLGYPSVEPQDVPGIQHALQTLLNQKEDERKRLPETFAATVAPFDIRRTAAIFRTILEEVLQN